MKQKQNGITEKMNIKHGKQHMMQHKIIEIIIIIEMDGVEEEDLIGHNGGIIIIIIITIIIIIMWLIWMILMKNQRKRVNGKQV